MRPQQPWLEVRKGPQLSWQAWRYRWVCQQCHPPRRGGIWHQHPHQAMDAYLHHLHTKHTPTANKANTGKRRKT